MNVNNQTPITRHDLKVFDAAKKSAESSQTFEITFARVMFDFIFLFYVRRHHRCVRNKVNVFKLYEHFSPAESSLLFTRSPSLSLSLITPVTCTHRQSALGSNLHPANMRRNIFHQYC